MTPCDDWVVHELMSHILDTQKYFAASAQGREADPPSPTPTTALGSDPVADFERARADTLRAFGEPGVVDRTGPSLGIAFSDQLLHGWDLARATGQDETMPHRSRKLTGSGIFEQHRRYEQSWCSTSRRRNGCQQP